eukprot:8725-Heterococcus_DN1.PRE.6
MRSARSETQRQLLQPEILRTNHATDLSIRLACSLSSVSHNTRAHSKIVPPVRRSLSAIAAARGVRCTRQQAG